MDIYVSKVCKYIIMTAQTFILNRFHDPLLDTFCWQPNDIFETKLQGLMWEIKDRNKVVMKRIVDQLEEQSFFTQDVIKHLVDQVEITCWEHIYCLFALIEVLVAHQYQNCHNGYEELPDEFAHSIWSVYAPETASYIAGVIDDWVKDNGTWMHVMQGSRPLIEKLVLIKYFKVICRDEY